MEPRKIIAYKNYFSDFMQTLSDSVRKKVVYVLSIIEQMPMVSAKMLKSIRDGLYEVRVDCEGNIYRIFMTFDKGNLVILFNGFQKKTQKTPKSEIEMALKIMKEYFESKNKDNADGK